MTYRIGSLFSGAGGLDMAVEHVFGGEVIWQSEMDKAASTVLAHRFPGVPNLGDITTADFNNVEPVDVICGGFPCQDVSAAGKRAGIKQGTRSGLWSIFADVIDQLRPTWVVIENVRGLLSARAHRGVEPTNGAVGDGSDGPVLRAAGAVLGDLADLGYDAVWATVAAADVGAPHRRARVFILATAAHAGYRGQSEWAWQAGRETGERFSVGHVAGCGGEDAAVGGDEPGVALLPTPTTQDGANNGGPSQFQRNTLPLNAEVMLLPTPRSSDCFGAGHHGDGGMDLRTTISLLPTPRSHRRGDCKSERNRNDPDLEATTHHFPGGQWGKYAPAIARWEALTRPAPAPTEPNKNGNPRLSAAFSEWLMGWPAGWVTDPDIGISRNDQLRIIGNGVCPRQAIAALRLLLTVCEVVS